MHGILPLSWRRTDGLRPVYHGFSLPLSRVRWITFADIPLDYSHPILHEDIAATFPDGYVFRGCSPEMAACFSASGCSVARTGLEAVLELDGAHMERRTVIASLARGRRHGVVEELDMHDAALRRLSVFQEQTMHAGRPQLRHLFRGAQSRNCRAFVFCSHTGEWLAAMTLSERGRHQMHTELMLRHRQAPGDIMECLVAAIFDRLGGEGMREWSLGEAPFMMGMDSGMPLTAIERFMVDAASRCRHAYDFDGLYRFKNKFAPLWRPVMLCSSAPATPLLLMELAIAAGYAELVAHASLGLFGQFIMPA